MSNVETLIGDAGADTVTLGAAQARPAAINLAAGTDTLTLGNFTNTATVSNVETLTGGTGADTITLGAALTTGQHIDLGAGTDKLTLGTLRQHRHRLQRRDPHRRHRRRHRSPSAQR